MTLKVPPETVQNDGTATISQESGLGYDVSLDTAWRGTVTVTVPLAESDDLVLHKVDGEWIAESPNYGVNTVSVDHLSIFTTLQNKAKQAACLRDKNPKSIITCLLTKAGVKYVSKQLGTLLAHQISDECAQHILESASGPGAIALSLFTGPCVAHAGEGDYTYTNPAPKPQPGPDPNPGPGPAPQSATAQVAQGPVAPQGFRYAITLRGFPPNASVSVTCRDSANPDGFYTFSLQTSTSGEAATQNYCYSADGPDHWITANGVESNRVGWGGSAARPAPDDLTETAGGAANTWTNYSNAGGNQGPTIAANQSVQIACKVSGFKVANGNTWWYRVASSPWNNNFYVSADAFYNNGRTSGDLRGTPFVDSAVSDC